MPYLYLVIKMTMVDIACPVCNKQKMEYKEDELECVCGYKFKLTFDESEMLSLIIENTNKDNETYRFPLVIFSSSCHLKDLGHDIL